MSNHIETFQYRISRPGISVYPGAQPGHMLGGGQLFKRHEVFLASPDPRRMDVRASLLDPFQNYRVRVFQQHNRMSVYVIADLSTSMAYPGVNGKLQWLSDFLISAAKSTLQMGDRFGFIGCGQRLESNLLIPAGSTLESVRMLAKQIPTLATARSADSLLALASVLPKQRALLFLVSDCHFSLLRLRQILQGISAHAVMPLVLWDEREYTDLPDWGLVRFKDKESGVSRSLFMRSALKQRIIQAYAQRQAALQQSFRAFGSEALFISGTYRPELLTQYFQQRIS